MDCRCTPSICSATSSSSKCRRGSEHPIKRKSLIVELPDIASILNKAAISQRPSYGVEHGGVSELSFTQHSQGVNFGWKS